MKRFHFRLETLLDLRKRKEEEVKLALGRKNQEIMRAKREVEGLNGELKRLQESEKKKRGVATSVLELRFSVVYRFKLKQDILRKGRAIDALGAEAAAIRKKLVKATQERRAIEIVRERQVEAWKKEYRSKEQGFIDDVSQQGFIRRTRHGARASA